MYFDGRLSGWWQAKVQNLLWQKQNWGSKETQRTIRGVSPDIIDFDATNIVTFNYSKTYERVYGGIHWREEVDHIHGMAQDDLAEETNIVLGVTTSAEKQNKNRYVEFEKYFQRITKRTGF